MHIGAKAALWVDYEIYELKFVPRPTKDWRTIQAEEGELRGEGSPRNPCTA